MLLLRLPVLAIRCVVGHFKRTLTFFEVIRAALKKLHRRNVCDYVLGLFTSQ
jgi:hypothetical protein